MEEEDRAREAVQERRAHQATRVEVMRTGDGGREAVFWTWDKSRTENVEWQHAHGRGDATKQETTQEGEEQEVKQTARGKQLWESVE